MSGTASSTSDDSSVTDEGADGLTIIKNSGEDSISGTVDAEMAGHLNENSTDATSGFDNDPSNGHFEADDEMSADNEAALAEEVETSPRKNPPLG